MKTRKKNFTKWVAIMMTAILAVGAMGLSLAYFTDTESVTNVFTVGNLNITLTETWNAEDGENMVPGDTVDKIPVITETAGDAYMRAILEIRDSNGDLITDASRLSAIMSTLYYDKDGEITAGTSYSTEDIAEFTSATSPVNTVSFEQLSSGGGKYTFVYKTADSTNIFAEGDNVTLFTNVIIPSDWTQTEIELIGDFKVVVKVEAIQAEGFATRAAAFTALDAELA